MLFVIDDDEFDFLGRLDAFEFFTIDDENPTNEAPSLKDGD